MNPILVTRRAQVSSSTSAGITILCSVLWLVAVCNYYATSGLITDWSGTPMLWVMLVVICPAVCFSGCMILLDGRIRKARELSFLENWVLLAAFMPITLGSLLSVWVVRVLLLMTQQNF